MASSQPDTAAFLSSMTFAHGDIGCECDECGPSEVPPTIRAAVEEHLRKRRLAEPSVFDGSKQLRVAQERSLVKREGGFALWRLELPIDGGDPIVEYRNSHRIVFVERLDKASQILSIGRGIIGSAAEENGRTRLDWEEGSAYFLPSLQGIACGWIHKRAAEEGEPATKPAATDCNESGNEATPTAEDVVLYSLKVPPETLEKNARSSGVGHAQEDVPCWVKKAHELFRQCLSKTQTQKGDAPNEDDDQKDMSECIRLSAEESSAMELIVVLAK